MLVTITSVEPKFTKNGDEYLVVKGVNEKGQETTKSVFSTHKDKWGLL